MNDYDYQLRELRSYKQDMEANKSVISDVPEFVEKLKDSTEFIERELSYMADGSYGAGVCFELQKAYYWGKRSKRCNYKSAIGKILLNALFWGEFRHWKKLPQNLQDQLNTIVEDFFNDKELEFGQDLLPELGGPDVLKPVGIDDFNRPVFKSIYSDTFFGSVDKIFNHGTSFETLRDSISEKDLVYFGASFGCEPIGTKATNIKIRWEG